MAKESKELKLKMSPGVIYVWVGGSCNYNSRERESGGAYISETTEGTIAQHIHSDTHSTEFRMILSVMSHALETLPEHSEIIFITNVSYIQQNFDRTPSGNSANSDLISHCITLKKRHKSVNVKLVPYHKYNRLIQIHEIAHNAMLKQQH